MQKKIMIWWIFGRQIIFTIAELSFEMNKKSK